MTNIAEFRMYQERWRKAVRRCEDLTDRQTLILLTLQDYENVESRTAWPSRDMLAEDCALRGEVKSRRRNVTNALSAGQRWGFIEVSAHAVSPGRTGGRGRSTVWRLTLPEGNLADKSVRKGSTGDELTDKSVRKGSVKGDSSVTVSEDSNIKGDRRSAKRVIVESPKGDPGIPPNPVGTPDKNPSYTGAPGSADAGKDGKAVEVPGGKLTDTSVRNGLVGERLTDKSVHLTDKSVPPSTLELDKEDKDAQMFPIAEDVGKASNEEAKTMPHLMPVGWQPNDIHRAMFARLHPGDDMALFTDCFIALHDGVESGDWNKKFGAYINRVAESEAAQVTHLDMELNLTA